MAIDYQLYAERIAKLTKEIKDKFAGWKEMTWAEKFNFVIGEVIIPAIELVEQIGLEVKEMTGKEKQDFAVAIIKAIWKELGIDLPKFPDEVFLFLLPYLIDVIVAAFNKKQIFTHK